VVKNEGGLIVGENGMEKLEKEGWVKTESGKWRNPCAPFVRGVSESDALKIQAMLDEWDKEEENEQHNEDATRRAAD